MTERQCTLLIEQHEAAQDWLREQVKGLGPPPTDRHGLHSTASNLKVSGKESLGVAPVFTRRKYSCTVMEK